MKKSDTLIVYDPALCCSSGVCGVNVDKTMMRFANDLKWLSAQGINVQRFNLAQQPGAFMEDEHVKAELAQKGESCLPLIKVNGEIKSSGAYPERDEMAAWTSLMAADSSIFSEQVKELVAIGAAIASNCNPCFKFHYDKARKLGVSSKDMRSAVDTAQRVKEAPANAILDLASRFLDSTDDQSQSQSSGGCCGPANSSKSTGSSSPSGCC